MLRIFRTPKPLLFEISYGTHFNSFLDSISAFFRIKEFNMVQNDRNGHNMGGASIFQSHRTFTFRDIERKPIKNSSNLVSVGYLEKQRSRGSEKSKHPPCFDNCEHFAPPVELLSLKGSRDISKIKKQSLEKLKN